MPTRATDPTDVFGAPAGGDARRRHLVLAGGGHTHIHVLKRLAMEPLDDVRVTLVSPSPEVVYSGMVPGRLVGTYTPADCAIDVSALAARAGAAYYADEVVAVDPDAHTIEARRRGEIPYDVLSLDVGSRPRGVAAVKGREEIIGVKPVEDAAGRIGEFLAQSRAAGASRAVVVGGGAGGVEVAFALRQQLPPGEASGVCIVEAAADLLPAGSPRLRQVVASLLPRYGIEVRTGCRFTGYRDGQVLLDDGRRVAADFVVWATGAEGLPFVAESGLAVDDAGFALVDDHLRCVEQDDVFAAGDCARMERHPQMPRAGVFAVRQGPILDANLRRTLQGRALVRYRPQRHFLSLLSTGDGRAVFSYRGRAGHGRAWWRLKDRIDRRFIRSYAPPSPGTLRRGPEVAARMPMAPCGGCAAKVEPDMLARTLRGLASGGFEGVSVGLEEADDAAVLTPPPGDRMVFTVDAFPPFLPDPLLVGEVAALNAVSDVYAMGGRPTAALALVGVATRDGAARESDLRLMMTGAHAALDRLGVALVGGHSIETDAPLIGFAVLGGVHDGTILTKKGARSGDLLVLTKPLGTGVVLAATRAGECPSAWTEATVAVMRQANDAAAHLFVEAGVQACTDVSGFGLAGHLGEMLRASGMSAELWADHLPVLPGALELLECDWRSSADEGLEAALARAVTPMDVAEDDPRLALLRDPQTSGGLLAAVPERGWPALRDELAAAGVEAQAIGVVRTGAPGSLRIHARTLVGEPRSGLKR